MCKLMTSAPVKHSWFLWEKINLKQLTVYIVTNCINLMQTQWNRMIALEDLEDYMSPSK